MKRIGTSKIRGRYVLYLLVYCLFLSSHKKPRSSKPYPNIIILYADDMGYGDLGIQNPKSKIPTPHLDKLANEGLLMTDAHSSSGICSPSRYALLTGRYHWRDFHAFVKSMGPSVFRSNQQTLPRILKANGYSTAAIGKWHLGWDWDAIRKPEFKTKETVPLFKKNIEIWPSEAYDWSRSIPGGPCSIGFDYYFGDGTINFPPYAWIENDKVLTAPTTTLTSQSGLGVALEGTWHARPGPAIENWDFYNVLPTLTENAVSYVKNQKHKSEPFFLYMAFPSPHAPIVPNKEFHGKSKAGPYGDFVYQTDWCVGEILNALEETGTSRNTIVIFSSDNGPEKYAYKRIKNFNHHSSAPFRGLKRDIYEGGHHVPFIVRWPKKIKPGSISDEVFSQVDILSTLAHLIDIDLPKGLAHDSYDFSGLWLGNKTSKNIRPATVQNTRKERYALRKGRWLFINHNSGYHTKPPKWIETKFGYQATTDSVQLFDLKNDIAQKINVAEQNIELVKSMKVHLEKIQKKELFIE